MSKLATALATAPSVSKTRKGPLAACDIYGPGDLDDYLALHARRDPNGLAETWKQVQAVIDDLLGIEKAKRIHNDKFRYHWNGGCGHWDGVDIP